jgi:hypothetical protein
VEYFYFCSNCLAQRRDAGHGRVLVVALLHGLGYGLHQRGVAAEVGEALAQVHRVVLGG